MSLITRCPACATQFKVVPDQLKLSDGWVRCGHCSDVFDATRYLDTWRPESALPVTSGDRPASSDEKVDAPEQSSRRSIQSAGVDAVDSRDGAASESAASAHTAPVVVALDADEIDSDFALDGPDLPLDGPVDPLSQTIAATGASGVHQTPEPSAAALVDFHAELQQFAQGLATAPLSDAQPATAESGASPPASARAMASDGAAVPAPDATFGTQATKPAVAPSADRRVPADEEPGFMRQGRRRAFWRRPGVRVLLSVVALLLSALLAVQWAVQERDRLAALHPGWQPLLTRLCEPLGCTIGAVRDLQAVEIDSSTLTRRIGEFYSFDLVLKNNATIPLAVPALELSLTNTADAVISRRVFLPEELPGVPALLPPGSSVPVSLRLTLAAGDDFPMAGYRALVFYP